MSLTNPTDLREVRGLQPHQLEIMRAFIQGAVYCWVKNRSGEWFHVRDLFGGENTIWHPTPLQLLYDKHLLLGKTHDEAFDATAKDVGWLVEAVLNNDERLFENDHSGYASKYRWVQQLPDVGDA